MGRSVAIALAGVVAVVLQTAVFPVLLPRGLAPNLLLVLVVCLAVHGYEAWGAAGAFALGYLLDTFSGTPLGLHAFGFTVVYVGVHRVARLLWTEGGVPAVLIVFAAVAIEGMLAIAITSLTTGSGAGGAWRRAVLSALTSAAMTPAVFRAVAWERRARRAG